MAFKDLVERMIIPGETFTLFVRGYGEDRDIIGNYSKEWTEVQTLTGLIQEDTELKDRWKGIEEAPTHLGLFEPDFDIPLEKIGIYRIQHYIPTTSPQLITYKILSIDRNLYLRNARHHYEMELGVDRKW